MSNVKAIVRDTYGSTDVLRLEEIDRPIPGDDEVLIRIRASSLNRADRYTLEGVPAPIRLFSGLFRPKKRGLGMDYAGDVEEVGSQVTDYKPGDAVYGEADREVWAEYACVPMRLASRMPSNLTYEQAAPPPPPPPTPLQGLRDFGRLEAGQEVLINGATGAVGPFAVQVAKALGARVTAVCGQRNVELVRSLDADYVIPYETEDFTSRDDSFDIVFDVIGNHRPRACRRIMKDKGIFVVVGGPEGRWLGPISSLLGAIAQAPFISQQVVTYTATPNRADLEVLTEMIESGKITPVIDRSFRLEEVAEALRYLVEAPPHRRW